MTTVASTIFHPPTTPTVHPGKRQFPILPLTVEKPSKCRRASDPVAMGTIDRLWNNQRLDWTASARLKVKAGSRDIIEYTREDDVVDPVTGRKSHLSFHISNAATLKFRQHGNSMRLTLNTVNPNELNVQNHGFHDYGLANSIPTATQWSFETAMARAGYLYNIAAKCREAGAHDTRIIRVDNIDPDATRDDVQVRTMHRRFHVFH